MSTPTKKAFSLANLDRPKEIDYMRIWISLFVIAITFTLSVSFNVPRQNMEPLPFKDADSIWVDSVFQSMTPEQRIAQLFMVAAYSNRDQAHVDEITTLVEKYHIGGLIFFQGGPVRQAKLTNLYQSKAKVPLLISIDGEWGLAMRLDSTLQYPRQMMLGAIEDGKAIYQMGADIAAQCKRLGIHVNLAPVIDVNNNPNNPVINSRSFGENRENVAWKGLMYMNGMQDNNVLAVAKHFPGHGDTDTDSHKDLPIINHDINRLNEIELFPFNHLIGEGLGGVMVAHLYIPVLDSTPNLASTLSPKIVTDLLKNKLGFEGLTFTDALNMKGVSKFFKPGVVDVKALLAGNDVLLFSEDVPLAIGMIKKAIESGDITQDEIDQKVLKILKVKYWAGLNNFKPIEIENLIEDLNAPKYKALKRKLVEESITIVKNQDSLLPLQNLDTLKIASITIGKDEPGAFAKTAELYTQVDHFVMPKKPTSYDREKLNEGIAEHNMVLVTIRNTSRNPRKKFGITSETAELIKTLKQTHKVVVDMHTNPYAFDLFDGLLEADAVVCSYWDMDIAAKVAAEVIFGGVGAKGTLPVTASDSLYLTLGTGISTIANRFSYGIPEEVDLNAEDLKGIDKIVKKGLDEQAYPGCQVLVAKQGKVVYNKSFGDYTYKGDKKVDNKAIYDLASITKIGASVVSLMKLQEEGKIHLDSTLSTYLPDLVKKTEYAKLTLREILAHQSGLKSWIPFYTATVTKTIPRYDVYSLGQSNIYPHQVAENFYIIENYPDSMYQIILDTPLKNKGDYLYSDLGYYFMKKIIEKQSGMGLDEYVDQTFYQPLGMASTTYRPLKKFSKEEIVPTEYDLYFRKQLIHGHVHDPGAAMLGGVGGHAGLFSNANDLAKLMQMLSSHGRYGGVQYLDSATVAEYTACQFCKGNHDDNRRGAGFDKPVREGSGGPTCDCVSLSSFGHSGFTGTLAWADPEEDIIFVFLSNRIYPDAKNKKLITMGIRTDIMQVIYDALDKSKMASE